MPVVTVWIVRCCNRVAYVDMDGRMSVGAALIADTKNLFTRRL